MQVRGGGERGEEGGGGEGNRGRRSEKNVRRDKVHKSLN